MTDGGSGGANGAAALPDGTYDAFILDTRTDDDGAVIGVDLTIVSGAHKGEVLELAVSGLAHDDLDLLGMPATLTVADGVPRMQVDD